MDIVTFSQDDNTSNSALVNKLQREVRGGTIPLHANILIPDVDFTNPRTETGNCVVGTLHLCAIHNRHVIDCVYNEGQGTGMVSINQLNA